jgi:signal transduction histidine kinase
LGLKQRQPTQYLNRLRYWLIITTLLGITGLNYFISPQMSFYMVGLSLLAGATILTGYNVLSHHTPDLKLLFGWGLHQVGMLAILAGITLAGFVGAVELYQRLPDSTNPWLWLTILAVLLASAYRPLIRTSNHLLTETIFGKSRRDEKQMIKRYSQSISSTLDLQRLSDITVNLMTETLNIDRGVVFINEREGSGDVSLRPYSAVGPSEVPPLRFTGDSPFVKHFIQKKAILSQYDIDMRPEFRAMTEEERRWLATLDIELYVPVLRGQALLGVLAFGPHAKGTAYNQDEKELMMMLADQSGLAFEGALLFRQLATVNEEVGLLSDRLSVLDRSKSDFLSIASHELRTPLTQIHTYSQLLLEFTEKDLQDETYVQTVFEGIARGSERLKEVIDMMLDVSAADLGKMHLFSGPVTLREVFEQAIRPFSVALEQRRLNLTEAGLANLPTVEADGTRLVQVLENLIGNAIKYTPDGGTITVRGRTVKDHRIGPAIGIAVIDQGIGIDPAHHETIFDKFFRVDESRFHSTSKTGFKGAGPGLGLTLVRAIVKAHRGRVWVESPGYNEEKCPGSTFYIVIPLPANEPRAIAETRPEVEMSCVG